METIAQAPRPSRCQRRGTASRIHHSVSAMTQARFRVAPALLAGIALGLAGCASQGDIRPTHELRDATTYGATTAQTSWPTTRWWSEYGDSELDRLVDTALAGQPNLKTVQARLQV